ncbi:hypothetical protein MASR1M60_14040 [Rhodocyclaceae bacterium]
MSTANLPKWLNPKPIPKAKFKECPSAQFESAFADWQGSRGDEFSKGWADYRYFVGEFAFNLNFIGRDFDIAEATRESLRNGTIDDDSFAVWARNTHPDWPLERIAYGMGWRLLPYARFVSYKTGDSSFAHEVETAIRAWCEDADVVWGILQRMGKAQRYRESHRALMLPILEDARALEMRVLERGGFLLGGC